MIAKGKIRGDGAQLAAYILHGKEGERAEFGGARGFDFFSPDLIEAARLMQGMADDKTDCRKAWFHSQTRLAPGEALTVAQWEKVIDREERRLGFRGHARVWGYHIDEATGDRHLHVAWFRIDVQKERAIDPGLYKNDLKQLSREIEQDFGLRVLSNERQPHDRARYADRNEVEESRRLKTDVRAIRNAILDCFEKSNNGRSFAAAIRAQGMELAAGDRRDCFVVVDHAGGKHALNKKLTGKTLEETRQRLSGLDRSQLPTVDQAKAIQRERQAARSRTTARAPNRYAELRAAQSPQPPPKVSPKFAREAVQAWERAEAPTIPGQATTRTTQARSASAAHTGQQTMRAGGATVLRAGEAVNRSTNTGGKGAGILARGILGALAGLLKWLDLFPAKPPSPEQQERNYYAAKEQQATDDIAAKKEAAAEQERRQRNAQQQDARLAQILGTRPHTRPIDPAKRGRDDDYGRGRERERER